MFTIGAFFIFVPLSITKEKILTAVSFLWIATLTPGYVEKYTRFRSVIPWILPSIFAIT